MTELPAAAARLWDSAMSITGGHPNVQISARADQLLVSREGLLEAIFADLPPSREDIRGWVIETARQLGFPDHPLTEDGTEHNPGRMTMRIPLERFDVVIVGSWHDSVDQDGQR